MTNNKAYAVPQYYRSTVPQYRLLDLVLLYWVLDPVPQCWVLHLVVYVVEAGFENAPHNISKLAGKLYI